MSKVHEIIQKKQIELIEQQIAEMIADPTKKFTWVKPWKGGNTPYNYVTKKPYRGVNLLLLQNGGAYMSFKQIQDKGLKLRKGAKSSIVVFWSKLNKKSKTEEDTPDDVASETNDKKGKDYWYMKYYKVFHESDIEGFVNEDYKEIKEDVVLEEKEEKAENLLKLYCEKELIKLKVFKSDRAFYTLELDSITVPELSQYTNSGEFISTLSHECIHSTGHEKRLNRDMKNSFGDVDYSKEELVAEIGASLFLATMGIENESTNKNSIAYIRGWLSKIKEDVTLVTYAAQRAQKAVNYIMKYNEEQNLK